MFFFNVILINNLIRITVLNKFWRKKYISNLLKHKAGSSPVRRGLAYGINQNPLIAPNLVFSLKYFIKMGNDESNTC